MFAESPSTWSICAYGATTATLTPASTGLPQTLPATPPSEKAWHSDPQRLLCRDACSLILLCATGQPWCPTSVSASSIVCFKNPKSARSGSLPLLLCGSFLSQRQVVSLYNQLDLIDRIPESLIDSKQSFILLSSFLSRCICLTLIISLRDLCMNPLIIFTFVLHVRVT